MHASLHKDKAIWYRSTRISTLENACMPACITYCNSLTANIMLHVHFCIQEKQNLGTTTCLKTLGTELIDNMCQKTALSTALSIEW